MKQTTKTVQKDAQDIAVVIDTQDRNQEQELLAGLIKRGVFELKPVLNKVGVHYVEVEETWKTADSVQIESILENLEKKGALVSKFIDRILTCPDCDSPEVYSKYLCPKCDSINVEYTELLEHMKCGYMNSKNKFMKGSSLVCPGCQTKLVDDAIQYRKIGNCYQCEKCGHRFDKPEIVHFCQQCKRSFIHREANYKKIYEYKIADETISKFRKDLPLFESVGEIFREKGFDAQFKSQLIGTSGVRHPFAIVAKKNGILLVVDVSLNGDKNDAVSLLGKKMDINPTECLLIDMSDRKELLSMGKVYGITILKGENEKQLKRELRDFLAILDSNRKQKVIETKSSDTGTFTTVRASKPKRKILKNQFRSQRNQVIYNLPYDDELLERRRELKNAYRRKPAKRRLSIQKKEDPI